MPESLASEKRMGSIKKGTKIPHKGFTHFFNEFFVFFIDFQSKFIFASPKMRIVRFLARQSHPCERTWQDEWHATSKSEMTAAAGN